MGNGDDDGDIMIMITASLWVLVYPSSDSRWHYCDGRDGGDNHYDIAVGDVEDAEDDSLRNDNDGNYDEKKDHLNTQALLQDQEEIDRAVSYTHLTLPTIHLV